MIMNFVVCLLYAIFELKAWCRLMLSEVSKEGNAEDMLPWEFILRK